MSDAIDTAAALAPIVAASQTDHGGSVDSEVGKVSSPLVLWKLFRQTSLDL